MATNNAYSSSSFVAIRKKSERQIPVDEIACQIEQNDIELSNRLRRTEWEEKKSWEKMCPHGFL